MRLRGSLQHANVLYRISFSSDLYIDLAELVYRRGYSDDRTVVKDMHPQILPG